ncbi:MAG: EAL domain-containing protein [Lachnospiraceae bacterium]|nr:EAL domain-containing protein [Lachnospiraceae bacterium]
MKPLRGSGKKKDNQSIVRILWIGLMILVINMVLFMLHIYDVQRRFRTVKIEEVYQNLKSTEFVLEAEYDDAKNNLNQIAKGIGRDSSALESEDALFRMLANCNAGERYDSLYFITDDGEMYGDDGSKTQLDTRQLKDVFMVKKATIRVAEDEYAEDGNGIIYYLQPVSVSGQKVGQLLAKVRMTEFFETEAFEHLRETGDLFLVSGEGDIFLRDTKMFVDYGEMYRNIFELLTEMAADKVSLKNITDLSAKSKVLGSDGDSKYIYLKTTMVDKYGMRDYIEFRGTNSLKNVYLVSIYPETVYTDVTKPLLFRTLMVSCIFFLITVSMVTYMWWTSKVSGDMIKKLAYEDPVTGGMNDNYFRENAPRIIWDNSSIPYVVTRFDIANFRYINEAYGHVRADELLRIIMRECGRIFTGKEFCARMTADQFLLLARNDQSFEAKFEELLKEINEQAKEIGIMFPIRLKRGIYPVRRDDSDIGIIIDHANAARKSLTGDEKVLVATYSEQIVSQMFLNDKIESEMENAMKTEEFKVFIQAKWDIKNDHVHGGEALVRWIKPDGSRIFPDQFIPVFEKNGFVEKLDMYMLEQVCKHQRQLIDEGREIYPISVNQSRLLMHNPDYLPQVERLMKKYRIPNGFVEIEITETVFQDERALMIHTTNELKKMDIVLDMDDFGSGYSSLNMLKDVPFDVIKIDREFFSESITSEASVWILQKIIEMAEGLGIRILCEGVENEEQVKLLRELGCYYVQGYFYSKPMPFDEYMDKYCKIKEGGKEYYDSLYESQHEVRETRRKDEEAKAGASVASAVEQFKKSYKEAPKRPENEKKDSVEKEENKDSEKKEKRISSEEMKLAYLMEGEQKNKDSKKEEKKEASDQKDKKDGSDAAMSAADAVRMMKQKMAAEDSEKKAEKEKEKQAMSAAEAVRMMKQKMAVKDGEEKPAEEKKEES